MTDTSAPRLTDWEVAEIGRANESGLTPVAFVHGLWLLSSSWQNWRDFFEAKVAGQPYPTRSDLYIGYGRALTGAVWYKDLLRLEYRYFF